jgi:WD40 repeat protein
VWDIGEGKEKVKFRCGKSIPVSLDLSPDNRFLACGCLNGDVVVWDCFGENSLWARRPFEGRTTDTKWSRDGKLLYGSNLNGKFWALKTEGEMAMNVEAVASTIDSITVTDMNLVVTSGRSLRGGISV